MIPTVIYDSDCRLCETSRQWIERRARKGRSPVALRFLHFEEPEAVRLQPDLDAIGCLNAFRFLDEEGRASIGAAAAVQIMRRLPGGRPVAWFMALPGVWPLTVWSYGRVAANRYRWFGKTKRSR
jgi:predicted DCC family thiol-disulfide oxidoreductase YuxK